MESTIRPAVDVGPQPARPGLALLLGLLAIPGTTIVWDLPIPVPGFLIGLPIAVGAIVLGIRARREGVGRRMATAGIVLASLAIAQMVIYTATTI